MERLPGFRDFYPHPIPKGDFWSLDLRNHIFATWRNTARRYGFAEYDGPPLEPLELYTAKSGQEIVGQLYTFTDKGDRSVAMRPEMTPTLARMVAATERNYKKPIKWFSIPQLFRYERQQKGRLREHFQFNADIFGETDPAADAELIALLIDTLREFGLTADDFVVRLSNRQAWKEFFTSAGGLESKEQEFFQIIDKIERESPENTHSKLVSIGIASDAVQEFIQKAVPTGDLARVVDSLKARGLDAFFKVDYTVIRGLAYYTGTVFEAFDKKGQFRAIAGGGRYDKLVHNLTQGKVSIPGLGFGMGDVVLAELLKSRNLVPHSDIGPDIFVLIEDEALRNESLSCIQRFREQGHSVEYSLVPTNPDKQFKKAQDLKAIHSARIEVTPEGNRLLWIKELKSRAEVRLPVNEAITRFKARTLFPGAS